MLPARVVALRSFARQHPTAISVAGCVIVAGALAIALAGKGGEFVEALGSAPLWVLGAAVALHVFWLVARSEARR